MKTEFKSKKVLLTDAGGFIASHLLEALVEAGAQVSAFVRYNSRAQAGLIPELSSRIQREVRLIHGDLRDSHAVDQAVRGQDIVLHLGAIISIPYSYVHPVDVIETNIIGTMTVLNAVRNHAVSRMVHTSSSEVYGTH